MSDAGSDERILELIEECKTVQQFIHRHRVEKGCEFTHTSLSKPAVSFYVPANELDEFFDYYIKAIQAGDDLHVTEKNKHIGPILIDLDFRYKYNGTLERKYTDSDICEIVSVYADIIHSFLNCDESIEMYVMEKRKPTVGNNVLKDGVHIVIPNIVTRASVKYLIRNKAVSLLKPVFEKMGVINSPEDIIDEAVIEKNNWFMFGSKKVGGEPYEVTHIYNVCGDSIEEIDNELSISDIVKTLSIRNKYEETEIKIDVKDEVDKFELKMDEQRKNSVLQQNIVTKETNNKVYYIENIENVKQLVKILSPARADVYNDWIRVGWCLRNIDNRLLDAWDEFSKQSAKYVPGICDKYWNHMREGGLGIGTLHMWAKNDSPDKYKEIIRSDLKTLLYQSTTGTPVDVAKVVHFMFSHEFVCASIKNRYWYQFKNHRWQISDSGLGLRIKISDDVWREYHTAAMEYSQLAISTAAGADQSRYQELSQKMLSIAIKLRTTSFKENLMKECSELFYIEKFEEKLDSNINLIGFENGVYDLETFEFREGRPEDYISFTTGNEYVEYDENHEYTKAINVYLEQVLTSKLVREYVMKLFSTFLTGAIKEQKFYIWTGSGSNSKSKLVELFEKAFGDYCCKFPITLLTQKRAASNAATSELARAKGKRFACLQEPSEDERINIGLMKELSGGDKILARAIYKEPVEFKPQFKMLLLCNHLPHVPSDDGGTWRRIRVVEFTSKFVENPQAENEFPIDLELSDKLEAWKSHFIAMLIEYFKLYLKEGISEPAEVLKCTNDYKNQNDYLSHFLASHVEKKDSAFLTLDEIYNELRVWIKDDGVPLKTPSKPDLERYLSKNFAKCVTHSHLKGFKGYRMRTMYQDTIEEALDDD